MKKMKSALALCLALLLTAGCGGKTVEQVEILEHERVTQAADHAEPALLRERANNERDDKRDPERRVHRPAA